MLFDAADVLWLFGQIFYTHSHSLKSVHRGIAELGGDCVSLGVHVIHKVDLAGGAFAVVIGVNAGDNRVGFNAVLVDLLVTQYAVYRHDYTDTTRQDIIMIYAVLSI